MDYGAPLGPIELLDRHNRAVASGDLDRIAADYATDAVIIANGQVFAGRAGAVDFFRCFLPNFSEDGQFRTGGPVVSGRLLYLEWTASAANAQIDDGVDTFVFGDDQILGQTVHYTLRTNG